MEEEVKNSNFIVIYSVSFSGGRFKKCEMLKYFRAHLYIQSFIKFLNMRDILEKCHLMSKIRGVAVYANIYFPLRDCVTYSSTI